MLYFAYGSNLHRQDWARWCAEQGLDASHLANPVPAWLPDHELVFHYRSRVRQGGAVDFRPTIGTSVPGGLFEVNEQGLAALDVKEGNGSSYDRVNVTVLTDDGNAHEAFTYRVCTHRREEVHVAPTETYLALAREGLQTLGHDTAYLEAAAVGRDVSPVPNHVFLYGTLMSGQARYDLIERYVVSAEPAQLTGQLVRIDWYPGLVHTRAGDVCGELMRFHDLRGVLPTLDEYEDFAGYGVPSSLYRRSLFRARSERGAVLCWSYVYLGEHEHLPIVESGDWRQHDG